MCVLSLALRFVWWLYTSYSILDASTEEYQEEEVYFQEEEDHFDQYTNQGKLIFLQATLVQSSPWARHHCPINLCSTLQIPVFISQRFTLISKLTFIVNLSLVVK